MTLHTGLYYCEVQDQTIAHLYEHLLIASFKDFIETQGFSRYLFGWLNGETFDTVLFLEYGFYDKQVENLFTEFIQSDSRINFVHVNNELERIAAEEGADLSAASINAVTTELQRFNFLPFQSLENTNILHDESPLETTTKRPIVTLKKKTPNLIINVLVEMEYNCIEQLATLLRSTPILYDTINETLFAKGTYEVASSWIAREPGSLIARGSVIHESRMELSSASTKRQIEEAIKLTSEKLSEHPNQLRTYANGFITTQTWNTLPIEYYRYAGVIASRNTIAELLTPEAVADVFSQIHITVETKIPS